MGWTLKSGVRVPIGSQKDSSYSGQRRFIGIYQFMPSLNKIKSDLKLGVKLGLG